MQSERKGTPAMITDADREAAADFLENWEPGPEMTVVKLARAFARHRETAVRETLERAAKVAGRCCFAMQGRTVKPEEIATAIRALGDAAATGTQGDNPC